LNNLASFWKRFVAAFIDTVIINVASRLVGGGGFNSVGQTVDFNFNTFGILVIMLYYTLMTWKFGATLGKMALSIKVQDVSGQNLSLGKAALREIVGKFISGIPLCLGFLWMIWDKDKQTWHDKMAKSKVVEA